MKKKRRIYAFVLSAVMSLSLFPVNALEVSGENSVEDGSADSIISLSAEATQMTVTVPAVLPASVDENGVVTTAEGARIKNDSYGAVQVKAVKVSAMNEWSLVADDHDFLADTVNSKNVTVAINNKSADENTGAVSVNSGIWTEIYGSGGTQRFNYSIAIPAQRIALADAEIATVVFTIDWYNGGHCALEHLKKVAKPGSVTDENDVVDNPNASAAAYVVMPTVPEDNLIIGIKDLGINNHNTVIRVSRDGNDTTEYHADGTGWFVIPHSNINGNYSIAVLAIGLDGTLTPELVGQFILEVTGGITASYTYTWKDGDTILKQETITDGDEIPTPPADPTKDGYIFDGWSKVDNYTWNASWSEDLSNTSTEDLLNNFGF